MRSGEYSPTQAAKLAKVVEKLRVEDPDRPTQEAEPQEAIEKPRVGDEDRHTQKAERANAAKEGQDLPAEDAKLANTAKEQCVGDQASPTPENAVEEQHVDQENATGASDAAAAPAIAAAIPAEAPAPQTPWPPHDPSRRRWAKVRLYTHALCGMGAASGAASLALPMILHCVSSQLLKHWCLIVKFLDEPDRDRIWLCDFANSLSFKLASAGAWHPRKGERINYSARPVSKEALRKGKLMERKFYLGTIQISENELKAITSTMKHNGKKYHPLARNCQDCSKDLCRRLGLSSSVANDHLMVFLCPPLALLIELINSGYNACTNPGASTRFTK